MPSFIYSLLFQRLPYSSTPSQHRNLLQSIPCNRSLAINPLQSIPCKQSLANNYLTHKFFTSVFSADAPTSSSYAFSHSRRFPRDNIPSHLQRLPLHGWLRWCRQPMVHKCSRSQHSRRARGWSADAKLCGTHSRDHISLYCGW